MKFNISYLRGKRNRKKNSNKCLKLTRHHRKPKSRGGTDHRSNISYVTQKDHNAWNILFDNLPPISILRRLVEYVHYFGTNRRMKLTYEPKMKFLTNKNIGRKYYAWNTLFANLTIEQIIEKINNTWLDPEFRLYVIKQKYIKGFVIGLSVK